MKNKATDEELELFIATGKLTVMGYELTAEEVSVSYTSNGMSACGEHYETHSDGQVICLWMTVIQSLF